MKKKFKILEHVIEVIFELGGLMFFLQKSILLGIGLTGLSIILVLKRKRIL